MIFGSTCFFLKLPSSTYSLKTARLARLSDTKLRKPPYMDKPDLLYGRKNENLDIFLQSKIVDYWNRTEIFTMNNNN